MKCSYAQKEKKKRKKKERKKEEKRPEVKCQKRENKKEERKTKKNFFVFCNQSADLFLMINSFSHSFRTEEKCTHATWEFCKVVSG